MRCPECKNRCRSKSGACPHCGADLVRRPRASSPLATLAGLACVGGLVFYFFFATPGPAPIPAARPPERVAARPAAPFYGAVRPKGPTLNGVSYENSTLVGKLDLTRPAPHPTSR